MGEPLGVALGMTRGTREGLGEPQGPVRRELQGEARKELRWDGRGELLGDALGVGLDGR